MPPLEKRMPRDVLERGESHRKVVLRPHGVVACGCNRDDALGEGVGLGTRERGLAHERRERDSFV
jgi:hypothetical protein